MERKVQEMSMADEMEGAGVEKHLLYVADPMCSWCYGFAPVINELADHFGDRLPVQLMMGGLRPGETKVWSDTDKETTTGYWKRVAQASGQPFDYDAFKARQGWVYDTEPACRAVVTMRMLNPVLALAYKSRIQTAFYAEGRDTTKDDVLADVAGECGVDREMFFAELVSEEARKETLRDFAAAQRAGIRGFPTLLAGDGTGHYLVVTNGYRPLEGLPEALEKWLDS